MIALLSLLVTPVYSQRPVTRDSGWTLTLYGSSPSVIPREKVYEIGHAFMCLSTHAGLGLKEECFGFYPRSYYKVLSVPAASPSGLSVNFAQIQKGEEIQFETSGTWCWGQGSQTCPDANGTAGRPQQGELPVQFSGMNFGQLMVRIGGWTSPIRPGKMTLTSGDTGSMTLVMNDRPAYYGDNSGALRVAVTLSSSKIGGPSGTVALEFMENPTRFSRVTTSASLPIADEDRSKIYAVLNDWNKRDYRLLFDQQHCVDLMAAVISAARFTPPQRSTFQHPTQFIEALKQQGGANLRRGGSSRIGLP